MQAFPVSRTITGGRYRPGGPMTVSLVLKAEEVAAQVPRADGMWEVVLPRDSQIHERFGWHMTEIK